MVTGLVGLLPGYSLEYECPGAAVASDPTLTPSRGSRGGSLLPLPPSGGSRCPWACGRLPPVSAPVFPGLLLCVCVSPLLCLRRTLSLDVGPPHPGEPHLGSFTTSYLPRPCFQIRSRSWVLGVRTWICVWGHPSIPYTRVIN